MNSVFYFLLFNDETAMQFISYVNIYEFCLYIALIHFVKKRKRNETYLNLLLDTFRLLFLRN